MLDVRIKTVVAALGLSALALPAFADAIDGNWCHNDGRRFSIRGAEIVTPAGKHMEGNYSRHWFSYTAPAPEPGAGQTIEMTLANENTVYLRLGGAGTPETWVRCSPSVSELTVYPRS
jgi:endonuclease YncB( thermonuclease family)